MSELNVELIQTVSKELSQKEEHVKAVLLMLEEGNTVPFIARYRKEQTGGMDEEDIRYISKEYEYGVNLQKRKEDVIRLIDEKGMLSAELEKEILACQKLNEIEDLYRPYKEKKKTRATEAKRKGLDGLANYIIFDNPNVDHEANKYLSDEVETIEDALQGAKDIIAEIVADEPRYRKFIKQSIEKDGLVVSKLISKNESLDEKAVYKQYYDYTEKVNSIVPHRVLALNRGEKEKILKVGIQEDQDYILYFLNYDFAKQSGEAKELVLDAIQDGYKRLIKPSIEREIRAELKTSAEMHAIEVFGDNLGQLLLQPPMRNKRVLGVDPAYRTGCKLCALDETQKVLEIGVVYPHQKYPGENINPKRIEEAKQHVGGLIQKHKIDIVAIGNGTASRETEQFIAQVIDEFKFDVSYVIVSEAGASVYSASDNARKEFPDFEVEERSAVSIGRRLQDPLSELVKIDPKSIGVGQYQHDVSQKELNDQLHFVVETAVNKVGVNINTASSELLHYVSGVSSKIADSIVEYRDQFGKFLNRKTIKDVAGVGPKAFEQSIGFLRIIDGDEVLDKTSIHPESYHIAKKLLKALEMNDTKIGTEELKDKVESLDRALLLEEFDVDKYTLDDILDAFKEPLRDPRDEFDAPILKQSILKLEDIRPGMELSGTVRNIVDFGAFVDCGVKVDGLVHISKITKQFIKHPKDALQVGQIVTVWVHDVDHQRQRLSLTMIAPKHQV